MSELHHAGDRVRRPQAGQGCAAGVGFGLERFYRDGSYRLEGEGKTLDAGGMVALYEKLVASFPSSPSRTACRG